MPLRGDHREFSVWDRRTRIGYLEWKSAAVIRKRPGSFDLHRYLNLSTDSVQISSLSFMTIAYAPFLFAQMPPSVQLRSIMPA